MADVSDGGDDDLMRAFVARRAELLGYLRAIAPPDVVEDAFQEVFLVVHRRLADFRRDGDFPAWVRGIARNCVRQLLRRSGRLHCLPDGALTDLIDQSVAEWEEASEPAGVERLRRCLGRLSGPHRRILELRYALDRPLAAIARELGSTEGSVQVTLSRLRASLADCIGRGGSAA
jgi:RNA polymerase sigma-70 factor (ECF subfamily)